MRYLSETDDLVFLNALIRKENGGRLPAFKSFLIEPIGELLVGSSFVDLGLLDAANIFYYVKFTCTDAVTVIALDNTLGVISEADLGRFDDYVFVKAVFGNGMVSFNYTGFKITITP